MTEPPQEGTEDTQEGTEEKVKYAHKFGVYPTETVGVFSHMEKEGIIDNNAPRTGATLRYGFLKMCGVTAYAKKGKTQEEKDTKKAEDVLSVWDKLPQEIQDRLKAKMNNTGN